MKAMKIISISTDRKIFEPESSVRKRMIAYAALVDELHIVVFSNEHLNLDYFQEGNLFVYPTSSKSRWSYINDAKRIARDVLKERPDISLVDTQDPFETGLVGKYVSKKFRLPLLIQVHTDFLSPYFKNSFLNKIRVFLSKGTLKQATRVRVVSERIKESLSSYNVPIDVLPIYVEENNYASEKDKDPKHILMVSRLEKEKDFKTALSAFAAARKEDNELKLTIVGDGSQHTAIESMIAKKGLESNVMLSGWSDELDNLYGEAGIFLNTSLYEGYGRTLIEAGFGKCAVVTTDVGLVGSVYKPNEDALVCPVGDVKCLSESILAFARDSVKAESFGQRAHEQAEKSTGTFDEYLQKYRAMWESCLN